MPEKFPGGTIMTPVCFVHDTCLELSSSVEERAQTDRIFLENMIRAIWAHHPLATVGDKEHVDLLWAITYYAAVDKAKRGA